MANLHFSDASPTKSVTYIPNGILDGIHISGGKQARHLVFCRHSSEFMDHTSPHLHTRDPSHNGAHALFCLCLSSIKVNSNSVRGGRGFELSARGFRFGHESCTLYDEQIIFRRLERI